MIEVILSALGVYGITIVITSYPGPGDIFVKFRSSLSSGLNKLFTCPVCLSWWIGLIFAFAVGLNPLEYFAVVGTVILAEELRG